MPEPLAAAWLAHGPRVLFDERDSRGALLHSMAWLARLEPEDLYYPSEAIAALRAAGRLPENGCIHADFLETATNWAAPSPKPIRAERRPAPNEPCSCACAPSRRP